MLSYFRPRIRSRHPSHAPLRVKGAFPLYPFRSVIRFGSTTEYEDAVSNGGDRIEVNTTEAVRNSSSKIRMKQCFTENNVKTADWWKVDSDKLFWKNGVNEVNENDEDEFILSIEDLPYPIISKSEFGSRNQGNTKHDNVESLRAWMEGKNLKNYIFEKYYNYTREYRLHVSPNGCFYTCRKMLKRDTAEEDKWYRNDEHCVWILEENENFDKPSNWRQVIEESVKALHAVGLDIGAVDLRIQSATDKNGNKRENPDFIIVEINSAPSFGEVTIEKYKRELTQLLYDKNEQRRK